MWGDYGYMEEGRLGKPYNLRLLKRLARFAIPYKRIVSIALFLSIVITILNLAFPYLSKVAIDGFILSPIYRVNLSKEKGGTARDFIKKYSHLMERSANDSFGLIANVDLKRIDPHDLQTYREKGIISQKRFYKTAPVKKGHPVFIGDGIKVVMADGSIAIPFETIERLKPEEILKIREKDIRGVAGIGMILLMLIFVSFGLSYLEHYLLELTGQKIMQDIRLSLFKHMQSQAVRFFDRNPVGRLVTRVTNDIENLNELFKSVIITVFKDIFILTGILAVLFYLNWRLTLICFTILPFIFGFTLLFSTLARDAFRELREKVAKLNVFLQERLTGMRIIQLFAREGFQMGIFSRINHENYLAGMKQIRVFAVFMPVMELFSSLAVALLIWYGGAKVIGEQLTLGALVAFISYIQMFFKPIRDIAEKYNIMQSAMASTERIFQLMDHREVIPDPEHPRRPSHDTGHLQFRDVYFAYNKDNPVLHGVSFEVKPGEMVAVVGPTGSGKTTMVNLMERFYEPHKGDIILDDVDIRRWPKSELHARLGLVMQDVFLFAGPIYDNISLGRNHVSRKAVEKAVREVNAEGFVGRLPDGLDQEIGEGGSTLSMGERQLLSFARALAGDPEVLILDEATSNVDPETERLIQEAIVKITERRTTFVVAHRLSTIRRADRILVMHHGRIREQGTHEELMALGGIYYKLNQFREV